MMKKKESKRNKSVKKAMVHYFYSVFFLLSPRSFSSRSYWEKRYKDDGDSGEGSYGKLSHFKSGIINNFVKQNGIQRVLELGCGDGNQLKSLKIPEYIGLDVSKTSIKLCISKFRKEKNKSFFLYDPEVFLDNFKIFKSELSMSLDVVYHLVEDSIFEKYMKDLFNSSSKWVVIYSSDTDKQSKYQAKHVKHRNFSKWIEREITGWKIHKKIKNRILFGESVAHFFIYKKV